MQRTLDELIEVEAHHLAFWQKFFNLALDRYVIAFSVLAACASALAFGSINLTA